MPEFHKRDYDSALNNDIIRLLEYIFYDQYDIRVSIARLSARNHLPFKPYLPGDPGRRERLISSLKMLRDDAAAPAV